MTWEEYVDSEIRHKQEIELEEKKIEVLARMEKIGSQDITVINSSKSHSSIVIPSKKTEE